MTAPTVNPSPVLADGVLVDLTLPTATAVATAAPAGPAPAAAPAVPAPAAAPGTPMPVPSPLLQAPEVVRASRARRVPLHLRAVALLGALALLVTTVAAVALAVATVTLHISFAPVLSPSMEPAFGPGDLIVTRALDTRDIAPGQVLVLPLPGAEGQRFVHRVTDVRFEDGQPLVRTKGDNNAAADTWELRVTSHEVPVVMTAVPDAGRLGLLIQGPAVRIALLVGVALLALVGVKRALLD